MSGALQSDDVGFNKIYSLEIEELIESLSKAFPSLRIQARGWGEDISDVWYCEFHNGQMVHRIDGPFMQ